MLVAILFQAGHANHPAEAIYWTLWPVAAAVLIADVLVITLAAVSLHASYKQYFERAASTSRNTSPLVSQSVTGEIGLIDLALKAVQDEYAREYAAGGIDEPVLRAFLKRQRERLPMASAVRMTDAEGTIGLGADDTLPSGVSVADRDYFLTFQKTGYTGTFVARPVFARVTLKWVVNTSRRLSRPDGSFDGVVYVQVPVDWFVREFAKLDIGPEGLIVLRGDVSRNFTIHARFPDGGFIGQTKVSPQLAALAAASPQGGTYKAHGGSDNIPRIYSYQPIACRPAYRGGRSRHQRHLRRMVARSRRARCIGCAFLPADRAGRVGAAARLERPAGSISRDTSPQRRA